MHQRDATYSSPKRKENASQAHTKEGKRQVLQSEYDETGQAKNTNVVFARVYQ